MVEFQTILILILIIGGAWYVHEKWPDKFEAGKTTTMSILSWAWDKATTPRPFQNESGTNLTIYGKVPCTDNMTCNNAYPNSTCDLSTGNCVIYSVENNNI